MDSRKSLKYLKYLYEEYRKKYCKLQITQYVTNYPVYWVYIMTYFKFIHNMLSCNRITPDDADIIHNIIYTIAEKTHEVWPESHKKVDQIIDQYQYMSIKGWVKLVYNFINEIRNSINKQIKCWHELDYSNIVDVLINTVNRKWTLPMTYTDLVSPDERTLSSSSITLFDTYNKTTILSFIKNL